MFPAFVAHGLRWLLFYLGSLVAEQWARKKLKELGYNIDDLSKEGREKLIKQANLDTESIKAKAIEKLKPYFTINYYRQLPGNIKDKVKHLHDKAIELFPEIKKTENLFTSMYEGLIEHLKSKIKNPFRRKNK